MKRKNESGMITVEAVLSLVPFILVVLGIISFTNIYLVHNKIQYALYEAGSDLSAYTYLYQATGLRTADLGLKNDIDKNTEQLNSTISQIQDFMGKVEDSKKAISNVQSGGWSNGYENGKQAYETGKESLESGKNAASSIRDTLSDPKELLCGLVFKGIELGEDALKGAFAELLANGMIEIYLDQSFLDSRPQSADEWLKSFGVKDGLSGLDFSKSEFLMDDNYRMIDIVAEYDIEVYCFKLFLKDPTIHVVQRCSIPAWLDGDGVSYKK